MRDVKAIIKGGQLPKGKVRVSGAKNSATRLLAAALISDEKVILENFPTELVDAHYKIDFIRKSGGEVRIDRKKEVVEINPLHISDVLLADYKYPIRTTYLLVPGLLKRNGIARVPYPGGCNLGNRGYDLHVMVWEKLGATVAEKKDYLEVSAPDGFTPGLIDFPISTTGGTESALICASTARGTTTIRNAYISPEIHDLIELLKSMGVKISVVGNSYIEVTGTHYLQGTIFEIMPDRIEALTWMVYGILSGGDITVENVPFDSMEIPLIHLQKTGVDFYRNSRNVHITPDCLSNGIQPFELATGTHPGVISDMQPFYVLLGLHAEGISRVFDYRYPERIRYCEQLSKLYPGRLQWEKGQITTKGKKAMPGAATVVSTDLRGSMALVIAALLSEGTAVVEHAEMALRGYNKLEDKLKGLGVHIDICKKEKPSLSVSETQQ